MSTIEETGLEAKWGESAYLFAYATANSDLNAVFDEEAKDNYMELDEIKIAAGPYLLGIWLAILDWIIEGLVANLSPEEAEIVTKDRLNSRRRVHVVFKKS